MDVSKWQFIYFFLHFNLHFVVNDKLNLLEISRELISHGYSCTPVCNGHEVFPGAQVDIFEASHVGHDEELDVVSGMAWWKCSAGSKGFCVDDFCFFVERLPSNVVVKEQHFG